MANELSTRNPLIKQAFQLKSTLESGFIHLGKLLRQIRDTEAWREDYESFDNPGKHSFLEDLNISKATANKLIQIQEKFIELGEIPEERLMGMPWGKLADTLSLVKTKEDAQKMLELVESSPTVVSLRDNLRELKTGVEQIDCAHEDTYELKICRTCNARWTI